MNACDMNRARCAQWEKLKWENKTILFSIPEDRAQIWNVYCSAFLCWKTISSQIQSRVLFFVCCWWCCFAFMLVCIPSFYIHSYIYVFFWSSFSFSVYRIGCEWVQFLCCLVTPIVMVIELLLIGTVMQWNDMEKQYNKKQPLL